MVRILLVLLAVAGVCFAQDTVAGDWTFTIQTPQGDIGVNMTLKVDGSNVTGEMSMADGSRKFPIAKGTADGGKVKLTVKRERPDGSSMVYEFAGTLEGGKIKGEISGDMGGQVATMPWNCSRK
ncbi:MAG TPA: hypothetical protein DEH78_18575 [Solibacterales bacterium]|nr:hypothetical protein [Bryobacterales bacterium]